MLTAFRHILVQNKNKEFHALMRRETSYQFYLKMSKNGYLEELYHDYTTDITREDEMTNLLLQYQEKDLELKTVLENGDISKYPEYLTYILHDTNFCGANNL